MSDEIKTEIKKDEVFELTIEQITKIATDAVVRASQAAQQKIVNRVNNLPRRDPTKQYRVKLFGKVHIDTRGETIFESKNGASRSIYARVGKYLDIAEIDNLVKKGAIEFIVEDK